MTTGIVLVYGGVAVIRTVTFSCLYQSLNALFIVASDENTVETTNVGGLVEDGHWRTDGVMKAEQILNLLRSEIRQVTESGTRAFLRSVILEPIDGTKPFNIEIVPHNRSADGRYTTVMVLMTDATSTIREQEFAQLKDALYRISDERRRTLRLADVFQHDVRNLMQAISLAVEYGQEARDDSHRLRNSLEMIAKTVERMEQLIDNVRVMMMAETMPSRVQKFALKELVNRAIAKAKSQTLDPAVRVGVRHPQEPLVVVADPLIEHALAEIARECMRQERADIARLNIDVKPDYEINTCLLYTSPSPRD